MAQLLRFVDRPGGTVLLDVSPGTGGVEVGDGGATFPPPPVARTVNANPVRDGGVVSSAPYGLRTCKLPLVYTPGTVDPSLVGQVLTQVLASPRGRGGTGGNVEVSRNGVADGALRINTSFWAAPFQTGTGTPSRVDANQDGPVVRGEVLPYHRATWTSTGTPATNTGVVFGSSATTYIEAAPGQFDLQVMVRTSTGRQVALVVTFHDSAGTTLGAALQSPNSAAVGGWQTLTVSTSSAPAGTVRAFARIYYQTGTSTSGETLDATALTTDVCQPYWDYATPAGGDFTESGETGEDQKESGAAEKVVAGLRGGGV